MQNNFLVGVLAVLAVLAAAPVQAEPGDYSARRTLVNFVFPPRADNPVTGAQAVDNFALVANPSGFDDGFEPAGYLRWQTVQLHPDTGAVCGNGTPYKFFVNRSPQTSNMVVYMEPGGACWDYESCTGDSALGARNPNGIPDDYMGLQNPGASLSSPFIFRQHPYSRTKVQNWTLVYLPYCTGDTHTGDTLRVYENAAQTDSVVWHHKGLRNVRAVIAWLKNNLQRPVQMLSTGCSAGGTGSVANYYHLRRDMEPDFGFMLNDSGPIFPAVADAGNGFPSPSFALHTEMFEVWGLDTAREGRLSQIDYMTAELPGFSADDFGSINGAVAEHYPFDRLGHTHFWQDYNYSRYSYERFYDFIENEPNALLKQLYTHLFWYDDTASLRDALDTHDNYGFYIPNYRSFNDSHCTTVLDFLNGDIQEAGLELEDFIDDLLNGSSPVMEAVEQEWGADFGKPPNLLYLLVDSLL